MSLGLKTTEFFQRLKRETSKRPPSPPLTEIPLVTLRQATIDIFREYAGPFPEGVSGTSFQDHIFKFTDEEVYAKIYTPERYVKDANSTVIFFQGNGFVMDMLDAHLPGLARMAKRANCQVIAIDTPLAPEYTAQEINQLAYDTVSYIFSNAATLNINKNNIILAGYSSGGNLVANILNKAKQNNEFRIKHQILISPSLDLSLDTFFDNPYIEFQKKDESVVIDNVKFAVKTYYQDNDPRTPFISPLFEKDLSSLPATTIILAEYDGGRGDGQIYAEKLQAAGVKVEVLICEGQTHNYFIARGVMGDDPDPAIVMAEVIAELS